MFYPDEVIEQVRDSNNIVDVIGSFVKLKRRGSSYVGLCPFHNEKTPSFSVSPDKQLYHCFGCGASGNVFTFVMEYENMNFQEAIEELAGRAGITLPRAEESPEEKRQRSRRQKLLDMQKLAASYYYYLLQSPQGEQARRYLDDRALSKETQLHFGLGYSSKRRNELYLFLKSKNYPDDLIADSGLVTFNEKYGASDRFWNRVMFPIMDVRSRVIGFGGRVMGDAKPKYVNSPETEIFDKSRSLYGLNFAHTSRKPYFILCEGYMDVIAMHQAGFTNAVASLGTAFTPSHAQMIKRYVQDVRLAYDSDTAGIKAALHAIPILKNAGITARVIHMDPCKDPDEFIKNFGAEEFQKRIDEAQSSFMFEISVLEKNYRMSDPEGRASFIKAAARKLLEFPQEVERNIYIESICSTYGIDSRGLTDMVNSFGAALSPDQIEELQRTDDPLILSDLSSVRNKKKTVPSDRIKKSQQILLTYLMNDFSLYDKLNGQIGPEDISDPLYRRALELALDQYQKDRAVQPARIVASFEDADQQKEIAELFSPPPQLDETAKQKILSDVIKNIKAYTEREALRNSSTMDQVMDAYNKIKKTRR